MAMNYKQITIRCVVIVCATLYIGACISYKYVDNKGVEHLSKTSGPGYMSFEHQVQSRSFICSNHGNWINGTFIRNSSLDICNNFLESFLHNYVATSWLFMGDSTMSRLFNQVRPHHKNCTKQRQAGRCNIMKYMGIARRNAWVEPTEYEGPLAHGMSHHFCTDCSGCNCKAYQCNDTSLEYLAVEYTRDVELQSETTNTTQQTVALYLQKKHYDICVINSGLHDLGTRRVYNVTTSGNVTRLGTSYNLTDEQYVQNAVHMISNTQRGCAKIVWISTSAVKGEAKHPQTNARIKLWNSNVLDLLQSKFPEIGYFDVYPMSNVRSMHVDNVHLNSLYYRTVANVFKPLPK